MSKNKSYGGIVLVCLVILFALFFINTYHPLHIRAEDGCEEYHEKCTCIGLLDTFASYPPIYTCDGFESCEDIPAVIKCE